MKKFKKLKKELDADYKKRSKEADNHKETTVKMYVSNDDDFLSPFSSTSEPIISEEVAIFIENQVQNMSSKRDLTLLISGECIDEGEKKIYPKAIKKYFSEKYISNKKELKMYHLITRILAFFGFVILGISIYMQYQGRFLVWAEAIDIVAWVFLWESVDISAFRTKSIRFKNKKYLSLLDMKIVFEK